MFSFRHRKPKQQAPVHYRAGVPIDTSRPLVLHSAGPEEWEHVGQAYPEIARIKKDAPFRKGDKEVVIFPPREYDRATLEIIAHMRDKTRENYVQRSNRDGHVISVVQHLPGPVEHHLYIFRLKG